MFFKKKKPKLDAKVRFQHKQFTTKLGSARAYRRTALAVPDSYVQKWLTKIGLGSRWSQIGIGLLILGVLYLVYFPNFLTLKEIKITGLSQSQAHDLEANIRDEIAGAKFYTAQNNLFLLNSALVTRAAKKLTSVNSIKQIKKDYKTHSLEIVAESKYEKYLVATPEKVFDIYNDGSFKSEAGITRDNWPNVENPSMIKVELFQNTHAQNGEQFFDSSLKQFLNSLNDGILTMDGYKLAYFSFKEPKAVTDQSTPVLETLPATSGANSVSPATAPESSTVGNQSAIVETPPAIESPELNLPFNSSEVNAVFYKGTDKKRFFKVIFDSTRDSQKAVDDLKLLLLQTTPDRFNQLDYIDMRIEDKAFICLLNAPCAK